MKWYYKYKTIQVLVAILGFIPILLYAFLAMRTNRTLQDWIIFAILGVIAMVGCGHAIEADEMRKKEILLKIEEEKRFNEETQKLEVKKLAQEKRKDNEVSLIEKNERIQSLITSGLNAKITGVVIDIETSQSNGETYILEIAAFKIKDGKVLDRYHNYINHKTLYRIDTHSKAVHGISIRDIREKGIAEEQFLQEFINFIGDSILIAHNASFDVRVLKKTFLKKYGLVLDNECICTLKMARKNLELSSYKLQDLCIHFDIPLENAHSAEHDVMACLLLYHFMLEKTEVGCVF